MHAAAPRQFETMAEQTKTGHIGDAVHVVILRQHMADLRFNSVVEA